MESLLIFGLSYSSMDTFRCLLGFPCNLKDLSISHNLREDKNLCTWLSVEARLSTPGRLTLVNQPKPLQNSKIELANFAEASSTTLPTPSTFRRLVLVWKKKWLENSNKPGQGENQNSWHFSTPLRNFKNHMTHLFSLEGILLYCGLKGKNVRPSYLRSLS